MAAIFFIKTDFLCNLEEGALWRTFKRNHFKFGLAVKEMSFKEKVYAQLTKTISQLLNLSLIGSVELKIDLVTTVNKIPHPLTPFPQHTTHWERHKIKLSITHKKTHTQKSGN